MADLLRSARGLLTPSGRVLARFPNEASPFGAFYQSGDVTHMTLLSSGSISQVAVAAGMRVVSIGNAARSMQGRRNRLVRRAAYLARDMIEWTLGQIYFGQRVAFDPMLTVVLAPA